MWDRQPGSHILRLLSKYNISPHIALLPDETDAKKILKASPLRTRWAAHGDHTEPRYVVQVH